MTSGLVPLHGQSVVNKQVWPTTLSAVWTKPGDFALHKSWTAKLVTYTVALLTYSWVLTSTATSYCWLGTGGSGGMGTYVLPPTRYIVTTRMTALKQAAVWNILIFHKLCAQSHKTVSTYHNFLKRNVSRSGSNRGPSAVRNSLTYIHMGLNVTPTSYGWFGMGDSGGG